jgi:hypothetical protein
MTNTPVLSGVPTSSKSRYKTGPWVVGEIVAAVILLGVGIYFVNAHWPYRYRNVEPLLQKVFASQIKIDHYHRTYFPHPGFVATGLILRRNSAPDLPPIGSARDLIVQGSWLDLLMLRHRVSLVDVTGLHVVIPPVGSRANHEDFPAGSSADFSGPTAIVAELLLHDATLDILRTNGGRYSYPIRQLVIRNLQKGRTITYSVDMQNAKPDGRIQATGSFGPLTPKNLGATPVSGDFTFSSVSLRDLGSLRGTLAATGHFHGALSAIEGDATSDTPDFGVGHGMPTAVAASMQCTVNGLNGDVILHDIKVRTGATTVQAGGSITGSPKVTDLELAVTGGRAQDLLRPFLKGKVPITGGVWLKAHAHLVPTGHELKFLQRLQVDGDFNVPAERLVNRNNEQKLSAFSLRAQGIKSSPAAADSNDSSPSSSTDVLSSLSGHAKLRDGVLSTQRITFQIPGASADLNGSFNLRDKTVHLIGDVRMQSDISHVTTGFKSVLLKPLIPFFKKGKAGAVIPIAVTGSSGQYKVTQDLAHLK